MEKHRISRVWVDDEFVYAQTETGLTASYAFERWPLLRDGSSEQRKNFYLSYGGIHWPDLDEDLGFEGMFYDAGLCQLTVAEDSVYYEPECI